MCLLNALNAMLAYPRFRAVLLAAFSMSALLLAAVGLYGVIAQLVAQRMPEFGVRRAVGAQTRDLVWLVARQGCIGVGTGLIAGLAGAFATERLIKGMLYGVEIGDAQSLVATTFALIMSAALGMVLPALRAARVDPMAALRQE